MRSQPKGMRAVQAPLARSAVVSNQAPRLSSSVSGKVCTRHREYVMDVTSAVTTLDKTQLQINPGLPVGVYGTAPQTDLSPFTWAPPIANNFERYRIRNLSFEYEPSCAVTQTGTFAMYIDYDPYDAIAPTKAGVLNQAGCVHGPLWSPMRVPYNHPQAVKWLLTRNAAIATGTSFMDYDAGSFNIVVLDAAAAPMYGRIYVTYDIEYDIPQTA